MNDYSQKIVALEKQNAKQDKNIKAMAQRLEAVSDVLREFLVMYKEYHEPKTRDKYDR